MNSLSYKGYLGRVEFDAEDGLFVGRIAGINDVIGFHGDTVASLTGAFEEAVEDYLATCQRLGRSPQRPYSGRFNVRIPPDLHARAANAAAQKGVSLNQLVETAIEEIVTL
jgi:predicted HicB family RNase H-like nuclease